MRITIKELRRIIKEEYAKVLAEGGRYVPMPTGNIGDPLTDTALAAALDARASGKLSKEHVSDLRDIINHNFVHAGLTSTQLLDLALDSPEDAKEYVDRALQQVVEGARRIDGLIAALGLSN